jgi:sugar phosphate isomerase/epimerase
LKDLLETKNGRLRIGGKRGESVCIGAGEIPTRQILQKLSGLGYNGGLTVEINHNENLITEIAESLENVKVML